MLNLTQIAEIAREVGTTYLGGHWIKDILTEETTDWVGDDAVRITMVLDDAVVGHLDGENIAKTLVNLRKRFFAHEDQRIPYIIYTTVSEMAEGDDPEC